MPDAHLWWVPAPFERGEDIAVGRAFLRRVLAAHTGLAEHALRFQRGPWGRPELTCARLRFNLSHTPGAVAVVVTEQADCGVDVEARRPVANLLALAGDVFSPQESRTLAVLPTPRRRARFFWLWTLKEAFIKAVGKGLALPLEAFSFHPRAASLAWSSTPASASSPGTGRSAPSRPPPDHAMAIALRGRGWRVHLHPRWP